jgi:hypothetical protein
MIVRELKKSGGAGDPLYYLIIDQAIEQSRASRVADIAVHNLPVMTEIPRTPGAAHELVKALTRSMNNFTKNARLGASRSLKNKLLHVVASFDPKDTGRLGNICGGPVAVARELARGVVGGDRAMILVLHDAAHLHVHILLSSADTKGRAWDSSFDRNKWNNEARGIERRYGLTPRTFDPERHSLSPSEHRRLGQCGIPDLLGRMRAAICAARADSPARNLFERRLEHIGISISEKKDRNGKVRGWVFSYADVSVKGSAIHRGLSYRNLTAGFSREREAFDPRHEQDVRNVMLLSMADEDRRRAVVEHPRAGVRYFGMMAEEFRAGRVDASWGEVDRDVRQRLSARTRLAPAPPEFVKLERAALVPVARNNVRGRDDQSGGGRDASEGHGRSGPGRGR